MSSTAKGVAGPCRRRKDRVLRSATADFASYSVLASGISGVQPTTTYTDNTLPTNSAQMFYKVEVE